MKIFKFGGASIKNAQSIRNMARIISEFDKEDLLIVVSAMGKTTNNLESVYEAIINQEPYEEKLLGIIDFHTDICLELFGRGNEIFSELESWVANLEIIINGYDKTNKDKFYDGIVSFGELMSSTIIGEFLNDQGISTIWLDARQLIKTDSNFKEGIVDWDLTTRKIKETVARNKFSKVAITQGFIGSDSEGTATTLGREGSDFTAAIFASCLSAESVTIWKDVPGILNADPKRFDITELYEYLSYQEAAEMTYYGATVIHPKTIKPLANKQIPLVVKSFVEPQKNGTIIDTGRDHDLFPTYVVKDNQCLISFGVKDLSFINERNLSVIFHILNLLHIKINMMQNSAVSLTICFDHSMDKVKELLKMLENDFSIKYNPGLQLITIKNYTEKAINEISESKSILVEQRTRNTYQIVVK